MCQMKNNQIFFVYNIISHDGITYWKYIIYFIKSKKKIKCKQQNIRNNKYPSTKGPYLVILTSVSI